MQLKQMPNLADRLKFIRQYHGLSQVELAEKAGTTQQAIQQAEKGKARQPRYLHRLAQELDLSIEWMIFGRVEDNNKEVYFSQHTGLNDKSAEVLDSFFAMPEKDQKLIYELMQSRKETDSKK